MAAVTASAREQLSVVTARCRCMDYETEESVQMTAMVAGAREQLAGVREKAVADVTVRELEMQARTA